ncbi:CsbD family protein [Lentisalinibacter salinarum]|uniref:CsbD family protein n=1 Tax=Lentisalinibacter salinarum TaxID=2992239 RepID=UPI00386D210C
MNKQQVKGELHKAKGKVKEVTGRATDNHKMEHEGEREQAKGSIQKAWGKLKDKVRKAAK